ncbi:thioesterase family protein [Aspergillus sclerotiicarbonarius CBS 121057]|uniref:Thioesterase family protein n=1 Tax=Aspergillus sclerotiicarbonarius (strain CBS 121057 / IBT 28362) TaxID=1448318 RepID=A0A319EN41_ASPSB|nr:thioesterase family protein [Aspergillus sclerotiicarbonarius CBS 121057]
MPAATVRPISDLSPFEQLVLSYSTGPQSQNEGGEVWDYFPSSSNLRLESATSGPPARVSYLLTVIPRQCNYLGNLHGGCGATIVDILSSTLLLALSKPGHYSLGGVSRNLKLTYLRPVPVGTEIRVMCEMVHMGKRMALLRAEIQRMDGGICVVAEHEKANTDPAAI